MRSRRGQTSDLPGRIRYVEMPKAHDHKSFLSRMALRMHIGNERVNVGWNVYLAPYISMLYYLSLMEIVVAKLFPDFFPSATMLAVASYFAFIWISYLFGKRHERMEVLRKKMHAQRNEIYFMDGRKQMEVLREKVREKKNAARRRLSG